jgi:hypothetical protein
MPHRHWLSDPFVNPPAHSLPNTMNEPTPDPAYIDKLIAEFQPKGRRPAFENLGPHHDLIVALRERGASYQTIFAILKSKGVNTSKSRVADYGRTVLASPKVRGRSRRRSADPRQSGDTASTSTGQTSVPTRPGPTQVTSEQSSRTQPDLKLDRPDPLPPVPERGGPRIARLRFADGTVSGGDRE